MPAMTALARVLGASLALLLGAVAFAQAGGSQDAPPGAAPAAPPGPAPDGMAWIPAGQFVMGSDEPDALPNERPAHLVAVKGFWLDVHDVTNAQYRDFADATGYLTTAERPVEWEELKKQVPPGTPRPPDEMLAPGSLVFTPPDHEVDLRDMGNWWSWVTGASWRHPQGPKSDLEGKDDYPVVQVSWDDAVAYAQWAGKRLPTEAEWEYAARGGTGKHDRFWWGDEFKPGGRAMANTYSGTFPTKDTAEDGYSHPSPWKAFPPNGYGLYDMAGNVWQWTADLYRADAHVLGAAQGLHCSPPTAAWDPSRDVPSAPTRVTKGGSFLCHVSYCESYRPVARRGTPYDTGSEHVGFRCAKDADAPAPEKPADAPPPGKP
jgi:formylglycine-generating enzyme required for sulfatase activity